MPSVIWVFLLLFTLGIAGGCGKSRHGPSAESKVPTTVSVVSPEYRDMPLQIKTPGMVLPYEDAEIFSWVTGFVEKVPVDIGSKVRKGEMLAGIRVPDLSNRFLKALAQFQLKLVLLKRYEQTIRESPDIVSQGEVDQAKALYLESLAELHQLGKVLELTVVRAPFSGVITRRYINTGDLTRAAGSGAGQPKPLFRIENTDKVRVAIDLPQRYVNIIRVGVPSTIQLVAPPVTISGSVTLISGSLNRVSKTMPVQAIFSNPLHILKPGMFVSVGILLETLHHVLTMPDQSIVAQEQHPKVYVLTPDNRVAVRPVTLGEDDGVNVQILSGLLPSDRVLVKGKHEVMVGDRVLPTVYVP